MISVRPTSNVFNLSSPKLKCAFAMSGLGFPLGKDNDWTPNGETDVMTSRLCGLGVKDFSTVKITNISSFLVDCGSTFASKYCQNE